ncbi:MAG: sulfatase-like hydrolase/transferase [Akkermansiaceae bacterium]|nr:sulfatase-like hydrolase/transferase [Akkermansiaceae bacterium]
MHPEPNKGPSRQPTLPVFRPLRRAGLALLFAGAVLPALVPVACAQGPPNILFFFLDDMKWDAVGYTGNSVITTPHMDSLATRGTNFENAFTTVAICGPSRASVFMGQHMARHGVITVQRGTYTAAQWAESYPAQLKADGYYMGFIGKHGHGNGFTGTFGTFDFDKGYDVQGSYFGQVIDGESAGGRHLTKFMGDLAIEFLGEAVDPAKNPGAAPFCLQISFKSPHNPLQPDPAYDSLYSADTIAHAKTDTQAQFDDLPSFIRSTSSAGTAEWNNNFNTDPKHQASVKKYYRLVHGVDVQIGRALAALDDPDGDGDNSDSLTDNTIVILGSDHGYTHGERHQVGKWYIHDESIRVPLVICDPRLPATLRGKRVSQMVLNLDIPATILDYAGVPRPAVMQGRSLRPIIEGNPPADWRAVFLHDHPAIPTVFKNEGVRTEAFSYTRYPNNGNVKQLYDVTVDPYQRTNLADDPRYASKLAELDALTTQLKADAQ